MRSRITQPIHRFCGSDSDRQSIGLPGHCDRCCEVGHVVAHPPLGCGDVHCYLSHEEEPVTRLVSEDRTCHTGPMTNTPEPATFVAISESAPAAYYEDYTTGTCGHTTIDGMVPCVIVATRRLGAQGRSDAQYVVDRLASGMYFACILPGPVQPVPNIPWSETIVTLIQHATEPTPAAVHDAAPEARGMVEVTCV